jgi:hypothetical protein
MIEERLEVVGASVAIVNVVGMLPDVAAEDRLGAMHQRILTVRRLHHCDLAVLHRKPAPTRAESAVYNPDDEACTQIKWGLPAPENQDLKATRVFFQSPINTAIGDMIAAVFVNL